jgi:hypothetical protein
MPSLFAWLVLLMSVQLMPLGMAAEPASATNAHHAAMPMRHCPEQAPTHRQEGFAACTMVCSAALASVDAALPQPLRITCVPELPSAAERLRGLHPETATPPPRRS